MLSLRSSRLRETTTIGNRQSTSIDRAPVPDQARTGRHMLPSSTNFILTTMALKRFTFMLPERGRSSGLAWRECGSVGTCHATRSFARNCDTMFRTSHLPTQLCR